MAESLPRHGLVYSHFPRLGGFRRRNPDSPNTAWENASFQGYADYTMTPEFAIGLEELLAFAAEDRTAMVCSESLWWRCHRRLVADRLTVAGHTVCHIGTNGKATEHSITQFAVVQDDGQITYPKVAAAS